MSPAQSPILEIDKLQVSLPVGGDRLHAIDGVSLALHEDEILCIVGESGSGKSMMARAIMGLLPGPKVFASGGAVRFEGENLLQASPARLRDIRGSRISMIFQEPMTALNPLMTIGEQIDEVLRIHTEMDRGARRKRVIEILGDVHLPEPEAILSAYPHQLSGGQRQRAMI